MIKNSVPSITNAGIPLSREQHSRQSRYLLAMVIRTTSFILTIFLPSPFRWFFLALSLILPYIAVVLANKPSPKHLINEHKLEKNRLDK